MAREWAQAQAPSRAVLATGSIYLVGDLLEAMAEVEGAAKAQGAEAAAEQQRMVGS